MSIKLFNYNNNKSTIKKFLFKDNNKENLEKLLNIYLKNKKIRNNKEK